MLQPPLPRLGLMLLMTDNDIHEQITKIQEIFPDLFYDENRRSIRGELSFRARYLEVRKGCWKIEPCNSSLESCVVDCYNIEIIKNSPVKENSIYYTKWIVWETDNRILTYANSLNKNKEDLHINHGGDCCLGIFYYRESETISEFIEKKVYPYFVWQAYYEKFKKVPPIGHYPHGCQKALTKFQSEWKYWTVNDLCPCGSNKKIKNCCGKENIKILLRESSTPP